MNEQPVDQQKPRLEAKIHSGARWFYWIAGLSVVNSIIGLSGGGVRFIIGLGITQLTDELLLGSSFKLLALLFDLAAAGIFALFGRFAMKKENWAFLTGGIFYLLDGLLLLLVRDWLAIAFHAFALVGIFGGYRAMKTLQEMEAFTTPAVAFDVNKPIS